MMATAVSPSMVSGRVVASSSISPVSLTGYAADALFASGKNTINEPEVLDCGKYAGMTTLEARKAILADLKEGGFLKEIEPLKHEVGTYRRQPCRQRRSCGRRR